MPEPTIAPGPTAIGPCLPELVLVSFGYLHGAPPTEAHLTVDVRTYLRDPAAVTGLLDLDGRDERVARPVAATRGALDTVAVLIQFAETFPGPRCVIAIGCAGGRHRSVALVELAAVRARHVGHRVVVEHRHVYLPRVPRPDGGTR